MQNNIENIQITRALSPKSLEETLAFENSVCINACPCFLLIYSGHSTSVFFYFSKISTEPQTSHLRATGTAARSTFHTLRHSQTTAHGRGEGREGQGGDVAPLAGHTTLHSCDAPLSHTVSHLCIIGGASRE